MTEFPKESRFDDAHSNTIDGKEYDVYKLIQYGEGIHPIKIEVNELSESLDEACWQDIDGKMFAPTDLLNSFVELGSWEDVETRHPEWIRHIYKVKNADYSYPILTYKYRIIDGMHRLLKAQIEGIGDLSVRVIDEAPESALYNL